MKLKESLTISIPAFNEEKTLEPVVSEALKVLASLTDKYDLFLINDGSTDQTGKIMDKIAKRNKRVKVVHHKANRGFSAVIKEGLFTPRTDLVLLAPADGQFKFSQVKKFARVISKYDAVFGYRAMNEEDLSRKFQSFIYHILGKVFLGIKLREFSSIYMWRTQFLRKINIVSSPSSNTAQLEIAFKAQEKGAKFGQVPIYWSKRRGGKAKGVINLRLVYFTLSEFFRIWWKIRKGRIF